MHSSTLASLGDSRALTPPSHSCTAGLALLVLLVLGRLEKALPRDPGS